KHSHTILTTPITNKDREAYRLEVQQPSSGAPQLHSQLTAYLAPMYTDAIHFLTTLDKANPQQPQRLTMVAGLPAREAVDTAATMLTTLLQTCRGIAMQTCNTKTLTRGGQHYQRRSMCKIRLELGNKLKTTRSLSRKARMLYKQNGVHPSIDDLLPETDTTNAEVREAVQARQGDGTTENYVQAALAQLTNSYRDQIHKLDDDDSALAIAQARLRMQHLISTQPKKANKYILRPSRTDHKGLQALADPDTKNICTAPADLNRVITAAYRQKLTPPTPKTGHYTNTQTRNYPWTRPKADDPFTLHTCQNVHWLHTAIMDRAGFQECISRLSGGKAPGPDGIENEIIKMLPWEMRDTIHHLFIIMWATGCTPTSWKTSDTCLLYKDKGQETDLNAYRPVGLANTIYKLWTSLITRALYEYAEANGMLSNCQAGFRSHRDTTQQLQTLVMALEDAKLAKVDIYALLVDFTSAFNTTCQDKLLWIMHDLGFPTDATDAVRDLYTGATTRFKTPYGQTDPVPVDRGTIQGDSLSPFLFLLYIEPLLRWLQVGARGYKFNSDTTDSAGRFTIGSIDYADDIAILCNSISNLRCQADKLSAYSDWGHLIISHSKTLATAALHKAHQSGRCSTLADAEKQARRELQHVHLQGKPVTYLEPTAPFTYLGVILTMTLNWKPQHIAMASQLKQKLDRLRRSFASARQAIHIIKTAIIPSLAYSFCVVPCTPGDLDLYDKAINQCVKKKLILPLGTPNAVIREDIDKLGLGISSTAKEHHARNTTALLHSLQSTDTIHAHITRCMLHKQITWLYAQAAKQGHRMLNMLRHTLRARQLLHATTAQLTATQEGQELYPKETTLLGQLITQNTSPLPLDIVSACMTCLKSLGIRHATEIQHTIAGNTYIISGMMLKERFHNKVRQKHYIALNRLTTMATQDRCPTTTEAKAIAAKRDTTLDLPAAQRLIKPWAAGLTELAPINVEEDTNHRYADIRAYVSVKQPTPYNPTHVTAQATQPPAAPEAIRSSSRLLRRENKETQPPPTTPTRPKAGTKRNTEGRQIQTIPKDIVRIVGLDLPGLSSWKVDKACRCQPKDLGSILGAMYGHQEAITSIDGWHWDGTNKESYYKVHWKPTVIDRWALHLCAKEGYTPTHIETISREEAKDVCTCELCWLPRGDCPTCHNCKRAYHPACLEIALLSGHKEPGYWLCPICKFGNNEFKTTMRLSAHSDLIRVHWRPTLEPAPLITAHLDYLARRSEYEEENKRIQEARYARPDSRLPTHTRQGLPDPLTWLPRCTNLHTKATFHTYPINPQTDIVGTGKCETFLQLHPHMTAPAMSFSTGEPIMPKHDLMQHVTVHDESGRTVGLLTKQQHQHLHAWLQHTPHTRNLATELVALLRRQDTQSSHHPMRVAQDKALTTLHTTRSFPSTVQRWADPLTVRPETTTYWSPDTNDTAFGAHHNCLLVRHTGLSTWNVPADDAVALKCVNHAIHSATQEEAMATIMLIPGKKGISYPKHIDTLRRYPEYCQHLASIPLNNTNCSKLGKHATLLVYVIWNEAGQLLTTKGNPQGWIASTATALHPDRETHPYHHRPNNQKQPATLPSGHKQHLRLPLDRALPTPGHTRSQHQLTHHSTTLPRMAITEWTTVAYTDGSCIKTSEPAPARVGAGVYIPENNALITIALNDPENNTINKAELTAIHAALKAGARRIATDSLCSLYQIRRALANPMSLINHRHNDILTDIATLIIDSPAAIQFFKVKAHTGIIGNEGADALAKHAALHPERANTLGYNPTARKERDIWLNNGNDGEALTPLPDCRHSVRAHIHNRHKLGLANQDSIYYQMTQAITKDAAKGAGERVMTDTSISIPAQRTALLYRTGGLYNQKLAMRWKKATDDLCPLCGEADSATHLLSGCSATLPLVQERHNGAGRLIAKAISKGTLGGCIRFADTGSWEKGAKDNLDLSAGRFAKDVLLIFFFFFLQVSGVDVGDVYAPVSKHTTLRTLLAKAAAEDMEVHQVDVDAAFLNGQLEPNEIIYVQQPEGFVEGSHNTVCKLQKALYGLRQAPRAWHARLKQVLEGMGFRASESDPALFTMQRQAGMVYLLVYVDDCLICTEKGDTDSLNYVKQQLSAVFGIKNLGDTKWFLGMKVTRDRAMGTLKLDQQQYVHELLNTYGMTAAHSKSVPMAPAVKLEREGVALDTSEHSYSGLVGSLLYLSCCTRPDITYAVGALARYMSAPTQQHWTAARAILSYLKGTADQGLVFGEAAELQGYCDADYAGDKDTARSTTGYVFAMNGAAISWSNRLQPTVAMSTAEAEYMAASSAVKEGLWLRKLMQDLQLPGDCTSILCDNQAALQLLHNPIASARAKHINVHHHFARERVARGEVSFSYCSTASMVADIMTKPLALVKFSQGKQGRGEERRAQDTTVGANGQPVDRVTRGMLEVRGSAYASAGLILPGAEPRARAQSGIRAVSTRQETDVPVRYEPRAQPASVQATPTVACQLQISFNCVAGEVIKASYAKQTSQRKQARGEEEEAGLAADLPCFVQPQQLQGRQHGAA
ncbi:hypothetical protein QJQ45_013303, partial [Haematococcus lacustris]